MRNAHTPPPSWPRSPLPIACFLPSGPMIRCAKPLYMRRTRRRVRAVAGPFQRRTCTRQSYFSAACLKTVCRRSPRPPTSSSVHRCNSPSIASSTGRNRLCSAWAAPRRSNRRPISPRRFQSSCSAKGLHQTRSPTGRMSRSLARSRGRARSVPCIRLDWRIDQLTLMESITAPEGPRYTVLQQWPLRG